MRLKCWLPHGVLATLGVASFLFDAPIRGVLNQSTSPEFVKWMGVVGDWGDWPELMVLSFVIWLVSRALKLPGLQKIIVIMAIGSTLSGMAVNTLRLTTGRTRPNNKEISQGFYGLRHEGRWLVGKNKYNSFPSGHMATASGFVLPVLFLRGIPAVPLLIFPALMAVARISTGAHHFSDTVCAFVISTWVSLALSRSRLVCELSRGIEKRGSE